MVEPAMPYLAPHDEPEVPGPAVLGHLDLDRSLLSSGRSLLLIGTLLVISNVGNPGADTVSAFLGFLLFVLGVFLVMLSPVVDQLPGAARVGATMANAVLNQAGHTVPMAEEQGEMPNYLQEQLQLAAPAVVPARRDRLQQLFLDAGRALMLCGALIAIPTVGNPTANAMHAFLGFLLWILGVTLLTLMPVARQFPQAARARVALASAVLKYFFAPWN